MDHSSVQIVAALAGGKGRAQLLQNKCHFYQYTIPLFVTHVEVLKAQVLRRWGYQGEASN